LVGNTQLIPKYSLCKKWGNWWEWERGTKEWERGMSGIPKYMGNMWGICGEYVGNMVLFLNNGEYGGNMVGMGIRNGGIGTRNGGMGTRNGGMGTRNRNEERRNGN
jgi:hypothetical protein